MMNNHLLIKNKKIAVGRACNGRQELSTPTEHGRKQNDELRIQRRLGPPDTDRRYLGNYQYFPKLCFEREEADLDNRSGAAARAGLDPLVLTWTA